MNAGRFARLFPLALVVAGCASFFGIERRDPFEGSPSSRFHILVWNEGRAPARVAALTFGRSVRLGALEPGREGAYSLPWDGPADIQFRIEVVGEEPYTTARFFVRPGESLQIRIREPVTASVVRR